MTERCLNPECEEIVDVIGVCVRCANNEYDPRKDGVSLDWEPYTTDGITHRTQEVLKKQFRETKATLERLQILGGGRT